MKDASPRTGRSAKLVAAAVVAGLIGSGTLVWQASSAAFTGQTENNGNSWTSGKVSLSDNDSGGALFTASGLVPNATDTRCIEVTYDGTVASVVRLYGATPTGTLGQYLDFDVSIGDGPDCTTRGTLSQVFGDANTTADNSADTLANFASARTNWTNGVPGWNPSSGVTTRPYVFTYTLADTNSAQNQSATLNFRWEAQS
jgi:hypothetical protein